MVDRKELARLVIPTPPLLEHVLPLDKLGERVLINNQAPVLGGLGTFRASCGAIKALCHAETILMTMDQSTARTLIKDLYLLTLRRKSAACYSAQR